MCPSVSIGLPVFNGADYLAAALDSLLAQDHADLELVISDNASTDGTQQICETYAARDPRVRYSRNDRNLGANLNFLRVLELARGELFMWASHDDVWGPSYVRKLVAGFELAPEVALVAARTEYVTEQGAPATQAPAAAPPARLVPAPVLIGQLLDQHATSWFYGLYRRDVLLDLTELLRTVPVWGGDLIFLMRLCLRYRVAGDDTAVIYKRLRTHTSHQPATPRAWARWQATFSTAMLGEVVAARRSPAETAATLRHLLPFLRRLVLRKGARKTAILWMRAAYQRAQGRDHA